MRLTVNATTNYEHLKLILREAMCRDAVSHLEILLIDELL